MSLSSSQFVRIAVVVTACILFAGLTYQQGAATSQQQLHLMKLQVALLKSKLAKHEPFAPQTAIDTTTTDSAENVIPVVSSKRTTHLPSEEAVERLLEQTSRTTQQPTTPAPTQRRREVVSQRDPLDNFEADRAAGKPLDELPQDPQEVRQPSDEDLNIINSHPFAKRTFENVQRAWKDPSDEGTVHVMVIPLFHDAEEVRELLWSIDAPVRLFAFSWNSASDDMRKTVDVLRRIPYGVVVNHFPENVGFSGAVNAGIRAGLTKLPQPPAKWFFIVNADTHFPRGVLGKFARATNDLDETYGLVYGPRQDHFAFVITRSAVRRVGYMDEVFWPGYMEDIDYHWRVRLGGLNKRITRLHFQHKQSANDRKPRSVTGPYQDQLHRSSRGFEYGWQKWGRYAPHQIELDHPPSGWKTPFNIPAAPLSLWAIDPAQRECVRTGKGKYHIHSSTCWYNGTVLLSQLPARTKLPRNLLQPSPSGG